MDELTLLANSKELRSAARISSDRWLDNSRWRPITIEEYVIFLDNIQNVKKELHAPDLPHPKMKGEKFSI